MIVTVDNETEMQPIDVYALFVTDDTIDMIVEETNRYAEQEIAAARVTRRSRLVSWTSDISGTRIQHTIQEAAGKRKTHGRDAEDAMKRYLCVKDTRWP